jgi:choline monooxygenase
MVSRTSPVSAEALAAVGRPIHEAAGLPNVAYTDEAYMDFERDSLFAHSWACIGTGKDLPAKGQVVPVDFLGLPLILLRDQGGAVKVFHNVCSHRGMQLIDKPCQVQKILRCPYHSWSYDLTGTLRATPHIGGSGQNSCAGFDRKQHGLKAVRSAVWCDQILINLSGDAPEFETYIARVSERWSDFDLELLCHGGPESSLRVDVACNWKLAVENYCESYHLPWIHPGLNEYSRLEDHYNIVEDGFFAGQGSLVYNPILIEDGPGLPEFPNLPEKWISGAEYIALFPNLLLGIHRDHFFALRIEPLGPGKSHEHLEIYYVGAVAAGEEFRPLREVNAAVWRRVFLEDVGVVEGMQRGRASPAFQGGVFSPVMDPPTHCFHRWVASSLARGTNGHRGED